MTNIHDNLEFRNSPVYKAICNKTEGKFGREEYSGK